MNLTPILPSARPLFSNVYHCQIQHFEKTVVGREHRFGFCDLSQLTVKAFYFLSHLPEKNSNAARAEASSGAAYTAFRSAISAFKSL